MTFQSAMYWSQLQTVTDRTQAAVEMCNSIRWLCMRLGLAGPDPALNHPQWGRILSVGHVDSEWELAGQSRVDQRQRQRKWIKQAAGRPASLPVKVRRDAGWPTYRRQIPCWSSHWRLHCEWWLPCIRLSGHWGPARRANIYGAKLQIFYGAKHLQVDAGKHCIFICWNTHFNHRSKSMAWCT